MTLTASFQLYLRSTKTSLVAQRLKHLSTMWETWVQSLVREVRSRQEYWSGLPFPPLGDLPNPGIEPKPPALQADSLPSEPQGKLGKPISHWLFTIISKMHLWVSGCQHAEGMEINIVASINELNQRSSKRLLQRVMGSTGEKGRPLKRMKH